MVWLPHCSARYKREAQVEDSLSFYTEKPPGFDGFPHMALAGIARHAALGNSEPLGQLLLDSASLFDDDVAALTAPRASRMLTGSGSASGFVDTAIVLGYLGHDTAEALAWFAEHFAPKGKGAKKLAKNKTRTGKLHVREVELMRRCVAEGLGLEAAKKRKRKGRGQPERSFAPLFMETRAEDIFDVAISMTSQRQDFVIPAAFAMSGGDSEHGLQLLRQGSSSPPGEVVATRVAASPAYDSAKSPSVSSLAMGLDAIVKEKDQTSCYYHCAASWTVPWICERELDAFGFLKWVDNDWEQVIDVATGPLKRRLRALRKRKTVYRITYDPTNSSVDEGNTRAAEKRHGVSIEMVPLLDA